MTLMIELLWNQNFAIKLFGIASRPIPLGAYCALKEVAEASNRTTVRMISTPLRRSLNIGSNSRLAKICGKHNKYHD